MKSNFFLFMTTSIIVVMSLQFGKMILRKYNLCLNISNLLKNIRLFGSKSGSNEVLFTTCGDIGVITLNRPKALNSLNLNMVTKIYYKLIEWECCKKLVIVKGTGGKAFCSGGDIKAIFLANKKKSNYGFDFFKTEYTMNGVIGTYKIPYIALIDGIVMGGGAGLSVHGHYRIATERTLFAMPETQIALFTDVGMSYFLSRLDGQLGLFLALTGHRLKGYDTVCAGIATHFLCSEKIPDLYNCLLQCNDHDDIKETLKNFTECTNAKFSLHCVLDNIRKCFNADSVECILENLKNENSKWGTEICKVLMKMSPTSLKVTRELLNRARELCTLEDCLRMEYNVVCNTLVRKEFYEGVRALLIDKDKKPEWNPSCLEDVSDCLVEAHFCATKHSLNKDFRKLCLEK